MTQPAINAVTEKPVSAKSSTKSNSQAWYRPTLSHEHGVYVMLLVSFLTGAALAQAWTFSTTLALVCAFFAWTAWAAVANRPNAPFSYTANWPHDDLVGNQPPGQFIIWSIVSIIILIAGIGVFLFVYLSQESADDVQPVPARPAVAIPTPSQKVTSLFFGVAMALFLVQIIMGMFTAHYAVEAEGFYGIPLSDFLPYAASRTWHLQLAIFWIATCWLAAGLYFAPRYGFLSPPVFGI